jgi:vacuolar-type H+-ATPase catalytic subunit A/Vma1
MRILVFFINLNKILAGLTIGDPVLKTGNPLSVELGPGMKFFQSL